MIKPIETVYNGYRFRSRLEARWAVLFDGIGIRYRYEPEGFALDDGTLYLPDGQVFDDGTIAAYQAARMARFEHGETPQTKATAS